jgi:DNA mismatch repair protein MutL
MGQDEAAAEAAARFNPAAAIERPPFSSMTLVGQVQGTYIIAEYGDTVYLIDQHAAHERVKYEETREAVIRRSLTRQQVAAAEEFSLTPEEAGLYEDNRDEIARLGLTLQQCGENRYLLQTVPLNLQQEPLLFLREALDLLRETRDNNRSILSFYSKAAYSFACKHAVKAGDRLSAEEMKQLLVQLDGCQQPDNCPHGRPTYIRISGSELAGRFYR